MPRHRGEDQGEKRLSFRAQPSMPRRLSAGKPRLPREALRDREGEGLIEGGDELCEDGVLHGATKRLVPSPLKYRGALKGHVLATPAVAVPQAGGRSRMPSELACRTGSRLAAMSTELLANILPEREPPQLHFRRGGFASQRRGGGQSLWRCLGHGGSMAPVQQGRKMPERPDPGSTAEAPAAAWKASRARARAGRAPHRARTTSRTLLALSGVRHRALQRRGPSRSPSPSW